MMQINGINYIDLDGQDGNMFALAGIARNWAKQLGMTDYKSVIKDISSYKEILDRFDAKFGDKVSYRFVNDPRNKGEEDEDDCAS